MEQRPGSGRNAKTGGGSGQTRVRVVSTNLNKATIHAASVGRAVLQPEVMAEFQRLPVERSRCSTSSCWGRRPWPPGIRCSCSANALALSTSAKVPDEILSGGAEVKQRMLKVIDYVLGDVAGVNDQVTDIRSARDTSIWPVI